MAATGAGAKARYKANTGKDASETMAALVDAIFEELKVNGSFYSASVTGTTATQIGPQPLTGGAMSGGKFDG